jgi:hypothetical protein
MKASSAAFQKQWPCVSLGSCVRTVDALLAHGEQGVAILPDGTLWKMERITGRAYTYRLLPLSAEAGDTPCPTCEGRGCEYGCGHCNESPSVAGPNAHRQCITCHGSGLSAEDGDT